MIYGARPVNVVGSSLPSYGARETAPPVMKIKLTLICDCCNKGLGCLERVRVLLVSYGHEVEIASRNMHGREPVSVGLNIGRTQSQIKENPVILLESAGLRLVENAEGFQLPVGLETT